MTKPPFEEVVKNYIKLVYFFAKKSLSDQADVDDMVQETFLKAMKTYDKFNFKSWLLTICRHLIIDQFRPRKHIVTMDDEKMDLFGNGETEELLEAQIDKEDSVKKIQKALASLKPTEKQIVNLRVCEEMEFKEIAIALSSKEAAIKMRFYRALIKLKESLI
jgi:RNA polymerase sigma-70 factor, ECF subfamily